jgi:hypothetical protein
MLADGHKHLVGRDNQSPLTIHSFLPTSQLRSSTIDGEPEVIGSGSLVHHVRERKLSTYLRIAGKLLGAFSSFFLWVALQPSEC